MGPGFSVYLNLLRFSAAFVVLVSHFAYPRISGGGWLWIRELNFGSDAVVVFFVLSGFVIALTAERKDHTLGNYAFSRATRMWSVAIPALVLGWTLDQWGAAIDPASYFAPYYSPVSLGETLLRGASFSVEWSGFEQRLGTNGPFWSLSYEVAYYALFAAWFYLSGTRRIALMLTFALIAGLNVLLLMPAWLIGVWLYRHLSQAGAMTRASALVLTLAPVALYAVCLWGHVPDLLQAHVQPVFSGHALRYSDEYLWNALLGALVALHLIGAAALLRGRTLPRLAPVAGWLAGASFSVYLVHYPVMQFLDAAAPSLGPLVLMAATLALCFGFAELFERRLPGLRELIVSSRSRLGRSLAG